MEPCMSVDLSAIHYKQVKALELMDDKWVELIHRNKCPNGRINIAGMLFWNQVRLAFPQSRSNYLEESQTHITELLNTVLSSQNVNLKQRMELIQQQFAKIHKALAPTHPEKEPQIHLFIIKLFHNLFEITSLEEITYLPN